MRPDPEEEEIPYERKERPLTELEERLWEICCEIYASDLAISKEGWQIRMWAAEFRAIVQKECPAGIFS